MLIIIISIMVGLNMAGLSANNYLSPLTALVMIFFMVAPAVVFRKKYALAILLISYSLSYIAIVKVRGNELGAEIVYMIIVGILCLIATRRLQDLTKI
ncbi:ABC-type Na+ efflux pump permease subunit [Rheinheimera pacifica]|uniref:DUF2921 family protein n=1 Tax=Rheinheimera pacifica TaxID=173990 RepID=UPI0021676DF0|nr:DUF2921 family protein [Rheinheimera pacifica]MCS4309498.1 ABC-type Na+ efflux pump permease subunit [Rheinheimera pacifica]